MISKELVVSEIISSIAILDRWLSIYKGDSSFREGFPKGVAGADYRVTQESLTAFCEEVSSELAIASNKIEAISNIISNSIR